MPKPSSASGLQPLDVYLDGCAGGVGALGGRPGAGGRTTTSAAAPARISDADGADLGPWTDKLCGGVVGVS